jgi:lipopolysaccharide transport system permease protein
MASSVTRIQATRGWVPLNLHDLWQYRGLLYFLAWRDIKVRYKQTMLGIFWAVLQPGLQTFIATVVFGRFMNVPSYGVPYSVLVMSGTLPWMFFSHALTEASNSVVGNANLISKVYFPRLIAPLAGVITAIPDFIVTLGLMFMLMLGYQIAPGLQILLLPVFFVLAALCALGVGVWFAALNAQFRDFRYVLPFFVQFWLFASPVFYSTKTVTPFFQIIYALNPMTGVIEGFRWALLGQNASQGLITLPAMVGISAAISLTLVVTGLFFFRRVERSFADLI